MSPFDPNIFVASRYFFDVLSMLQGVFIFIVFVCKRSVLKVVTGRDQFLVSSKENEIAMLSLRDN